MVSAPRNHFSAGNQGQAHDEKEKLVGALGQVFEVLYAMRLPEIGVEV